VDIDEHCIVTKMKLGGKVVLFLSDLVTITELPAMIELYPLKLENRSPNAQKIK
jgi:hypothetical protein